MTRQMLVLGGAIALAVAALGVPASPDSGVTIKLFQFQPASVTTAAGTRVTWSNQDEIEHTITAGSPENPGDAFDLRLPGKGATASTTFGKPGIYPYFCARHPSMRGEIRVR